MELNNIKTPSELTPCPVVEASMEVRFSRSDTPIEVIMSMIIENVRDKFENFQKLPIANLPENIRDADPNLKYASGKTSLFGYFAGKPLSLLDAELYSSLRI